MNASTVVSFLVAWCAFGLARVRRAERDLAGDGVLRAPWPELTLGVAIALIAVAVRTPWQAAACGSACIALVVASGADVRTGYIFDAITLPAAIVVALLEIAGGNATSAAWGVVVVAGTFGSVVVLTRGRAMGLGDVKAMYAIGAAFGPFESLVAMFAACMSGIVSAKLRGALVRGAEIRFGPHLAFGSCVALVVGEPIVHQYLGL